MAAAAAAAFGRAPTGGAGTPASGAGAGGSSSNNGTDNPTLSLTVTEAEPHGEGMNAFMAYKISVKTTQPRFMRQTFVVTRRYSEFAWLQEQLVSTYPTVIVPPLPDKVLVGRMSDDIVRARTRSLELFLKRVAAHPRLSEDKLFFLFLEGRDEQLATVMESTAASRSTGGGLLSWVGSAAASLTSTVSSTGMASKSPEDIAFEEISAYVDGLEPQLANVQTHIASLVKKRKEMANSLFEFGLAFTLLGKSGRDLLANALTQLGKTADTLSVSTNQHADREVVYFQEQVDDYVRMIKAVKGVLNYRAEKMVAYRTALQDLENKRSAAQRFMGVAGKERQHSAAEAEVAKAQVQTEQIRVEYDRVSRQVLEEVEAFKTHKLADFRNVVLDFVQLQIDYCRKLEDTWNELIPALEVAHVREHRSDSVEESKAAGLPTSAAPPTPASVAAPPPPVTPGAVPAAGGTAAATPAAAPAAPGTPAPDTAAASTAPADAPAPASS